jgi:Ulp1 family protease
LKSREESSDPAVSIRSNRGCNKRDQFATDSPLEGRVRSEPVSEISLFRAILEGNELVFGAENHEESQPWLVIALAGDRF